MRYLVIVCLAAVLVQSQAQNKVCDPLDDGPYLGTQPTLEFAFDEATQNELTGDCSSSDRYKSPIRLFGGDRSFFLTVEGVPLQNPLRLTTMAYCNSVNLNYLILTKAVDRDGFTSSIDDNTSYLPVRLRCSPQNGDPVQIYDARFFIRDVNDNVPVFPHNNKSAEASVSEAMTVGGVVMTVIADDKDANLDKNITYSLINHKDKFSMDSNTGAITLTAPLDYEAMGEEKYLDLILTAQDGGPGLIHTVTTTARVHVTDSDDQAPAFSYSGCFKHEDVCAWPKYTAGLTVEKDKEIKVFPVPNKVKGHVDIEAYDRDLGIANEIVFSVASTIPPGSEKDFRVETTKTDDGKYKASVYPVKNLQLKEGFEIFLKAEEQSVDHKHEIAMIFFMESPGSASAGGQTGQDATDDDDDTYTARELALIVVVAILATLVLCLLVGLLCAMRRSGSRKEADIAMGQTNNGFRM